MMIVFCLSNNNLFSVSRSVTRTRTRTIVSITVVVVGRSDDDFLPFSRSFTRARGWPRIYLIPTYDNLFLLYFLLEFREGERRRGLGANSKSSVSLALRTIGPAVVLP